MSRNQTLGLHLENHLPQIRRVVQRVARNEGLVDDIVQECCVHLIQKEHLCTNQNTVKQWLNTVIRNVTIKKMTKKTKEQSRQSPLTVDQPTPEPLSEKFSETHIAWVLRQFPTLPPMQQKVLKLRYIENMKTTEIAKQLNIAQSTVALRFVPGVF